MTVRSVALVPSKFVESVQSTQYTAVNVTTVIGACTVSNNSASVVNFIINLVTSGGIPAENNALIYNRLLQAGKSYTCPELVGQVLQNGDAISAVASSASALSIRISGIEIT